MKIENSKNLHIIFDSNMKYIGVGEDHVGAFAFNFKDSKQVEYLKNFLNKTKNKVTVWYEGPSIAAKSKSFKNFEAELKQFQSVNNFTYTVKGWETDLKFNKEYEYAGILLGAEVRDYVSLLGTHLNGKKTLLEAMVDCKNVKGTQPRGPTKDEVIKALSDSGKPCDVLLEMMKPKSATKATLELIYGGGNRAMRAKYFAGTPGAKTTSQVYKRVDNFNKSRDMHLAKKMQQKGGIFLAGDGHIEHNIKEFLI
jgi:hypothetical protein